MGQPIFWALHSLGHLLQTIRSESRDPRLIVFAIDTCQAKSRLTGFERGFLTACFQFLNNVIRIFIHFFIHTYFQKIQTMFLEQHYQMGPKSLENRKLIDKNTIVKFELFYCLMP